MSFDRICFDFDSTLSRVEGIDELAKRVGLGDEMARLTNAAMNGEVSLESVYGRRLELIKPDREAIDWLSDLYIREIVDGVTEVFEQLLKANKNIHIISGGILQAILPMAKKLHLPEDQVHAVKIFFNEDGSYHDFDRESMLARTGGKADACRQIGSEGGRLAMVGDGKTDLEAKQAGASFIGFGGVAERAIVKDQADYYISTPNLIPVLEYLL